MTTENVDIQVKGQVAPKIENDLRSIAKAATDGYTALERLQQMLNSLDSGGAAAVIRAQAQLLNATARVTEAQTNATVGAARLATEQQKLATEVQKTQTQLANVETALQKAIAAEAKATLQTQKLDDANEKASRSMLTSKERMLELAKSATAQAQAQKDANVAAYEAAAANQSAGNAIRQQTQFTKEQILAAQEATRAARDKIAADRALVQAETDVQQAQQKTTLGWRDYNTGLAKTGSNAQLARHHLINLGFQLQDIGVSLASGQNPLTVAVQQGAQIQGIASQANVGIGRLALAAGSMVARFLPLAAAAAAVAGGFKIVSDEVSKTANLKAYSEALGLTSQQIKKMHGDVVTMGDAFKAFFVTLSEVSGAGKAWDSFVASVIKAYKNIIGAAVDAFNVIGAFSSASAQTFLAAWEKLPASFRNVFVTMANSAIGILEALVNFVIAGVNQITEAFNKISKIKIDPIAAMPFDRIEPSKDQQGDPKDIAKTFMDTYTASFKQRTKEFDDFYKKWQANSVKGAKERIKTAFEAAGGDKAGESRAATLAKINLQLDNQLERMQMLKPVREQQQQFDQIEEQLTGRKIKLNAEETASIKAKIAQIAKQKDVTAEMDKIYEQIQGPSDQYAATLTALDKLLKQGFISQDQYNAKLDSAVEAYNQTLDPLRKYRQELEFQASTYGKTADEIDIMSQRRQIEQEALRNGTVLRKADVDALMQQAQAQQYANGVNQQYQQIVSEGSGQLEQFKQKQDALTLAYNNGKLGLAAYQAQMVQTGIQAAQLRLAIDQALPGDTFTASFAGLLQGYQGMLSGLADSFSTLFSSISDGFANAIAGAILGTESLGDALRNVARQAVQQLIASLIKLGLQYAINAALGNTLGAASTAASVGFAAATATAWATPAALVSLASFGANSAPASAGIVSTVGLSQGLALAGFQDGGYTGDTAVNKIAGVVHGQEYVMRADTVSRLGLDTMDAIQNGKPLTAASSNTSAASKTQQAKTTVQSNVYVTLVEDASKAGQIEKSQTDDGTLIKAFVANIREQGEAATIMENAYGLKRQGQ